MADKNLKHFVRLASELSGVKASIVFDRVRVSGGLDAAQKFSAAWQTICAELISITYYAEGYFAEQELALTSEYWDVERTLQEYVSRFLDLSGQRGDYALLKALLKEEEAELAKEQYLSRKWYLELADCLFVAWQLGESDVLLDKYFGLKHLPAAVLAVCKQNMTKFIQAETMPDKDFWPPEAVIFATVGDHYQYAKNEAGKILKPKTYRKAEEFLTTWN